MTATLLAPPDEIICLSGISWSTYETLLEELSDRRLRLTYNRSQFFANLSTPDIAIWLQKSATMDYLTLVKAFRVWVQSQIGK
jgi:hypothetical protein